MEVSAAFQRRRFSSRRWVAVPLAPADWLALDALLEEPCGEAALAEAAERHPAFQLGLLRRAGACARRPQERPRHHREAIALLGAGPARAQLRALLLLTPSRRDEELAVWHEAAGRALDGMAQALAEDTLPADPIERTLLSLPLWVGARCRLDRLDPPGPDGLAAWLERELGPAEAWHPELWAAWRASADPARAGEEDARRGALLREAWIRVLDAQPDHHGDVHGHDWLRRRSGLPAGGWRG